MPADLATSSGLALVQYGALGIWALAATAGCWWLLRKVVSIAERFASTAEANGKLLDDMRARLEKIERRQQRVFIKNGWADE